MPLLLREVNNIRWWDSQRNLGEEWLKEGELRSDALKSLRSKDNKVSVFLIEDDASNLDRILAAFAAGRQELNDVDFAIVDFEDVKPLGLELRDDDADTPDSTVNAWHRDIVHLSATKVLALANHLQIKAHFCRRRGKHIHKLIKEGIAAGHIDKGLMRTELLKELT